MKKDILLLMLCLFCSIGAMAQTKTITGVVSDAAGEPIIGASVVEVGTTNGTITDIDGKFVLNMNPDGKIRVSYIGYQVQTIDLKGKTSFRIQMKEDSEMLEEVVVTGYGGKQLRTKVTNSISKVHLEHDADDGEDKIAKKARLEQLEPMEVVQYYLNRYHKAMEALNVLPPSIEPHASGHIIEQIQLVEEILKNGYAYESKGSVYFDVAKYNKDHHYGVLSGRNLDDVLNTTRELDGQEEKHNPADFALWKCAQPEHIMRWPSPWSNGFPGWHCECTAMGRKYLGETFDIHGGGMDLVFPHHECEIAQAVASEGHQMVHYWMHNNMITINGQKMGKSLGNFITLDEFFTGSNKLLTQAYSPMTIRFFILQAHYRSTVDFSNEALQAAEKGLERLLEGVKNLERITPAKATSGIEPQGLREKCYEAMNDDLNTPIVISHLFDATRMINTVIDKKATISAEDLEELKSVFHLFVFDLLGLKAEAENNAAREEAYGKVVDMLLEQRMQAKANKDWATSDKIRDNLAALGFEVKDTKDGFTWKLNK